MTWNDQTPPAAEVLLAVALPDTGYVLEVDELPHAFAGAGRYRATCGNLFGSEELMRHHDLRTVVVLANRLVNYVYQRSQLPSPDEWNRIKTSLLANPTA